MPLFFRLAGRGRHNEDSGRGSSASSGFPAPARRAQRRARPPGRRSSTNSRRAPTRSGAAALTGERDRDGDRARPDGDRGWPSLRSWRRREQLQARARGVPQHDPVVPLDDLRGPAPASAGARADGDQLPRRDPSTPGRAGAQSPRGSMLTQVADAHADPRPRLPLGGQANQRLARRPLRGQLGPLLRARATTVVPSSRKVQVPAEHLGAAEIRRFNVPRGPTTTDENRAEPPRRDHPHAPTSRESPQPRPSIRPGQRADAPSPVFRFGTDRAQYRAPPRADRCSARPSPTPTPPPPHRRRRGDSLAAGVVDARSFHARRWGHDPPGVICADDLRAHGVVCWPGRLLAPCAGNRDRLRDALRRPRRHRGDAPGAEATSARSLGLLGVDAHDTPVVTFDIGGDPPR